VDHVGLVKTRKGVSIRSGAASPSRIARVIASKNSGVASEKGCPERAEQKNVEAGQHAVDGGLAEQQQVPPRQIHGGVGAVRARHPRP
jgi:hypothetical protein